MTSVAPRPAASLVLVKDTFSGPEVLIGWRRAAARAFPGAVVFPGGKIEPGDAEAEGRAGGSPGMAAAPPGAAFAALRETFEEAGLWLAEDGAAPAGFPDRPGLSRLAPYAHWITPAANRYRFDTWFFLAVANAVEAEARLFGDEFEALSWAKPAWVLEAHAQALLPPTRHSLERLTRQGSSQAILADARANGLFDAGELGARWATAPP